MRNLNPLEWAVLPLKKYADFSGRAPRAEYWWFYLGTVVVSLLCALLDKALGSRDIIGTILNIALLVPWLAVTVRRLHDIDRTGWWLLAFVGAFAVVGSTAALGTAGGMGTAAMFTTMIVVVVGVIGIGITMLVFMVQAGTDGANRYGDDPYGPGNLEQVFA